MDNIKNEIQMQLNNCKFLTQEIKLELSKVTRQSSTRDISYQY